MGRPRHLRTSFLLPDAVQLPLTSTATRLSRSSPDKHSQRTAAGFLPCKRFYRDYTCLSVLARIGGANRAQHTLSTPDQELEASRVRQQILIGEARGCSTGLSKVDSGPPIWEAKFPTPATANAYPGDPKKHYREVHWGLVRIPNHIKDIQKVQLSTLHAIY